MTREVDCISRQKVIDLMMQKWGENFSGDDAMQESIDAIREMPLVTPQEPILDKITEIIEPLRHKCLDEMSDIEWQILRVIDKYKAEVEPQESEET